MKREGYWLAAIIALVALAIFANVHTKKWHFGLDIDGGIRAVMQADVKPGMAYDQQTVLRILENRLNASGVAEPSIQPKGQYQFIVELPNVKDKDTLIQQLQTTAQLEFRWFRNVSYSSASGARYICANPPGTKDYQFTDRQTNRTFGDQAHTLTQFQLLLKQSDARPGATAFSVPAPLAQYAPSGQTLYFTADQQKTALSLNQQLQDFQTLASGGPYPGTPADVSPLIMTGNDIQSNATAALTPQSTEPVVDMNCTPQGAAEQRNFTTAHNEQSAPGGANLIGIILDGHILEVPSSKEPILDGATQISGGFSTLSEAQNLANMLNAGALPVPLSIVQVQSVDATLGHAPVLAMEKAGIIGGIAVLLFMLIYYMLPGLVADIALLIYALFAMAIFKAGIPGFVPPITLTLPGIAGFILSVGMAVDANILIFERLKEELRNGKPLRQAIDAGFKRAFTAIRDSNACTLITCIILATIGTKEVQGFAITLGIGVVLSLFTAITVTRTLLYLLVDAGAGKNTALFGLKRQWMYAGVRDDTGQVKSPLNVIGNRKIFYGLSLLVIVPGVIFYFMGGLKQSIEFTGGTQVEAKFNASVPQETVQHAMVAAGYKDNMVQMAEGGQIAFVSIRSTDPLAYKAVEQALLSVGVPYQIQSHGLVGGVISTEMTQNAFQAVVVAALLIVLYLAIAFGMSGQNEGRSIDSLLGLALAARLLALVAIVSTVAVGEIVHWHYTLGWILWGIGGTAIGFSALYWVGWMVAGFRFGVSAIVALLHDVLVLIGSFAILGYFLNWQIDSMFIVATLTVVGFSVHDTIVIFDRLRENLRHRMRGETFEALANRSILQSFARSINTSFTVIMTLIAMMIFGEPSTRLLIAALLIGIVSGTYSSIFNATPLLVDWEIAFARLAGAGVPNTSFTPRETAVATGAGGARLVKATRDNGASKPTTDGVEPVAPDALASRPSVSKSRPKKRSRRF